jgi:predicted acyl esterase
VLKQPWCNGRVGTFGVSYEATAAVLATMRHPAIKACAPLYPFLDIYNDGESSSRPGAWFFGCADFGR